MHGDTFTPEELAMLSRVFDRCKPIEASAPELENQALKIILQYRAGVTDEAKLIELCRESTTSRD